MKIIFIFHVPGCSGMFQDVPCSWFYRRPSYKTFELNAKLVWVTQGAYLYLETVRSAIVMVAFLEDKRKNINLIKSYQ